MRWLLLLTLGCSGCVRPSGMQSYHETVFTPAILLSATMPSALAVTTCSLNNVPIIRIDSTVWHSQDREMVLVHEDVHAQRAYRYRGGCWPFMYRIARDKTFRVTEQFLAFCAAGRYAITRNHNPEAVWTYIVNVMIQDTVLTPKDNCIYTEGR